MNESELSSQFQELATQIRGEVMTDEMSRHLYSTDASLYQLKPLAIVTPKDAEDIIKTVQFAARNRIPLMGRGSGTSLAGQTVTTGIVVDCSKYMNGILELNCEERWVRVQPGIVLDNLNDQLAAKGLFFAPDVATSSRANVGGMMGNNSSGVRSVRYGKTVDHVLEISAVLPDGHLYTFGALDRDGLEVKCQSKNGEGKIYRGIRQIVSQNRERIIEKFPKVMRRVSGYNLDELLDEDKFNLAKILVGSEGTLAVVTEAKLNLEPIPKNRALAVLHFDDLLTAIRTVPAILKHSPSAVEILDHYGLELGKQNPVVSKLSRQFIQGSPEAVLMVEFASDSGEELKTQFENMKADPIIRDKVFHVHEAWTAASQQVVWQVRKNALGVMLGIKGDFKPLPFIEDSAIPVEHLADYIAEIQALCKRQNRQLAMYAHASVGVIHVRPLLNLKQKEDVEIMQRISNETFKLVQHYGGSWSGEHGDGLVRSYKIREFFGDELTEAFGQVKAIFDPAGIMNPGKIVNPPPMTENLRINPNYKTHFPKTFYRFGEEGGFDLAIEMCTGVGQCRKSLAGTMCPSYIATRDEEHSTRGRANALRSAIAGDLGPDAFTSKRLHDVLDLCLECKACKSECPSNVDMAKMKAEFLAHYYGKHGYPLEKKMVAATRRSSELGSRFPRLANALINSKPVRWFLERNAGIDRRRKLPELAVTPLTEWYRREYRAPADADGTVILFADTFVNFYDPEVGKAAIEILSALKKKVRLFHQGCCGRPLISAGKLAEAKENGNHFLRELERFGSEDAPVIVLEPSCFSTLKDDYPDLVDPKEEAQTLAQRVTTLEQYVLSDENGARLAGQLHDAGGRFLVHGHCQQKALIGSDGLKHLLQLVPGAEQKEVPDGCCGMAGSFGYESEHYELSEKIGERHLLPAVRNADPDLEIVVSGFSCRSQIEHFAGKKALHPAQVVAKRLKK
ncbi:MAG: FAD-binding protein [Acidobacteriota bacterium]|nr:MAG: FAD-binding protein [Acidobacteriota bacterium]